jgi:hypothetical protein
MMHLRCLWPRVFHEGHHNVAAYHFQRHQASELRSDGEGESADEVDLMLCIGECDRLASLGGCDELLPHQASA